MENTAKKIVKASPIILIVLYIVPFLTLLIMSVFTQAPRELRDAANVSFAARLVEMQNPYALSNSYVFIESINVYPPFNMLIAAVLHKITGINLYHIFYGLDLFYVLATAIVIALFVRKQFKVTTELTLLAFAVSLTLGWRIGFISTVPDHLGMLICVLLLISVHNNKNVFIQALLTVLAFYSKQYFLAVAASVFCYYCIANWKKALQYFLYTTFLGFLSLFIIDYFCPSFTVQILFFMLAENDIMNTNKILYSIKQMSLVLAVYGFYSVFVIKRIGLLIRNLTTKRFDIHDITVYDINNILMFVVLLYLGTNKGAFLSYHLTLMIPGFIILGSREISRFVEKKEPLKRSCYLLCIIVITFVLLIKKYYFPYVQNDAECQQYEYAETLLNRYAGKQYLLSELGYCALKNQMPIAENGHAEYLITLADSLIINTAIDIEEVAKYFPYIYELYDYSVLRRSEVISAIEQQDFSLITRNHGNTMIYGYDITSQYECIDSIPLTTGMQHFVIDFYIPKEKYKRTE